MMQNTENDMGNILRLNKFRDNTERKCLVGGRMANCFALLRPPMLQNQNDKDPRQREHSRPAKKNKKES